MRILVTGGAGFLGSHLCDRLLEIGHEVIVLDNLFTSRRHNLAAAEAYGSQFEFVRGDVCDPMHFEVDQIYHLACPASPVHYQRNPARTIRTCVEGTLHALELAREVGARLIIPSTSEVYGDPLEHPQRESYWGHVNPIGPRACYDEGKRCAEALAVSYARQYAIDVRIPRIFNTYGPRMHPNDGRVVSNFICQALAGQPITIFGSGSQTRSFCYVDDLVAALMRLMEIDSQAVRDGGLPLPINLGNPGEFTIRSLADMVVAATESRSQIVEQPLPQDDPIRRRPDVSRAWQILGWRPVTHLGTGLVSTIDYFRKLGEVKAKVSVRDHGLKRLFEAAKTLAHKGEQVKVGVLADAEGGAEEGELTVAEIAAIMEFGTEDQRIPARSFIRRTFDEQRDELVKLARELFWKMLTEGLPRQQALGLLGAKLAAEIKKRVTAGEPIPPPNAPSTIAAKGSDRPLVNTGRMINAVTWQVGDGKKE